MVSLAVINAYALQVRDLTLWLLHPFFADYKLYITETIIKFSHYNKRHSLKRFKTSCKPGFARKQTVGTIAIQ